MLYIIRIYQILLVKITFLNKLKSKNVCTIKNCQWIFVLLYFEKCENKASSEKILFYHLNSSLHYKESIVLFLYNTCNRLRDSYNS